MTYNVKDVFYLDLTMTMPTGTAATKSNTAQLDLSAYIDPIARGRSKGTGLAIYKVQYAVSGTAFYRSALYRRKRQCLRCIYYGNRNGH